MTVDGNQRIAVINYGLGNIFSVQQALSHCGVEGIFTNDPDELRSFDGVILPGVGAFGKAMENLSKLSLDESIREFASTGKPLMGICLGMQLFMSESEEFGIHAGLNLIPGTVRRFPTAFDNQTLRVPYIGWNGIVEGESSEWTGSPMKCVNPGDEFYFVHSYHVVPENRSHALSVSSYKEFKFVSAVKKDNLFATQFHPEKSGQQGILIFKHWLESIGAH